MIFPISQRGSLVEYFGRRPDVLLAYSGGNRMDYSKNANHLVVTAQEGFTFREGSSAWNFQAVNKATTSSAVVPGSKIITALMWIRINAYKDAATSSVFVITEDFSRPSGYGINESATAGKSIKIFIFDADGVKLKAVGIPKLSEGVEYFLVVLFDNSTALGNIRVLLNAVEIPVTVDTDTKTSAVNLGTYKVSIGGKESGASLANIVVSDFMLLSTDLLLEQGAIQDYYAWATGFKADRLLEGKF